MNAHASSVGRLVDTLIEPLAAPNGRPLLRETPAVRVEYPQTVETAPQTVEPARPSRPFAKLRLAASVRRERAALADASPEMLRDIGLTPGDAALEAARPVWDLPQDR